MSNRTAYCDDHGNQPGPRRILWINFQAHVASSFSGGGTVNPYQVGDQVIRISTGEPGTVVNVGGEMCDTVFLRTGRTRIHYQDLTLDRSDPISQLLSGELTKGKEYGLRLQAKYLEYAYRFDPLAGLSNARVELMPHQVFLAHRIGKKHRPRMILSDEVGLGKTIEAGLVMKELIARGLAERVLVICPASLQYQWQRELQSKFNEEFTILDGESARFHEKNGANPWTKFDKVITSIHLARREDRALQITEATWDLVIFDEAHHARRRYEGPNRSRSTLAYDLISELKSLVNGLLLLTATPMQLHPFELFSMIELVEPGLFPSFDVYDRRRKSLPALNELMRDLQQWEALSPQSRGAVLAKYREIIADLHPDASSALNDRQTREEIMDRLSSLHPLVQVLVRNRKAVVGGFKRRVAHRVMVALTEEERRVYEEVSDYINYHYNKALSDKNYHIGFLMVLYQKMLASSSAALRASLQKRLKSLREIASSPNPRRRSRLMGPEALEDIREQWDIDEASDAMNAAFLDSDNLQAEIDVLDRLITLLGSIRDSKAEVLLKEIVRPILEVNSTDKVLIFTTFKHTQKLIVEYLNAAGIPATVFHGGLTLEEKEKSVQRFRDDVQVMISTEAGGEGRNFQFARNLVNYDLPWNPMVVEQRIGRLDRIGQKHDVRIFNLSCIGTVEERVLRVLDERIGLFEESVGSLDPILGDVEDNLESLLMAPRESMDDDLDEYASDLEAKVRSAREAERLLADFILDRASFRRDVASELLEQKPLASWTDLQAFIRSALDYLGGQLSEHSEGGEALVLSPKLQQRLRVDNRVTRGAFNPRLALSLEELDFFAIGHEVIDSIVGYVSASSAYTGVRRTTDAPPGIQIEIVYQLESNGLVPSGRIVRHLVGEDLSVSECPLTRLPDLGTPTSGAIPSWAESAVRSSEAAIQSTQEQMRDQVQQEHEEHRQVILEREKRLYEYQKSFLEGFISEKQAWIANVEEGGTRNQKRILPAIKGKVRKYQERLEILDDEYEEKVRQIRDQRVDVVMNVISAGLVVGE